MPIKFIGLKSLSDNEIYTLNRICDSSLPKIERDFKRSRIVLRIKKYDSEGKRARYSLHSQIIAPSLKFTAKADSWTFSTALHKIFNKLEIEITKKTDRKIRQKTVRF